jgi:hypothetical protein
LDFEPHSTDGRSGISPRPQEVAATAHAEPESFVGLADESTDSWDEPSGNHTLEESGVALVAEARRNANAQAPLSSGPALAPPPSRGNLLDPGDRASEPPQFRQPLGQRLVFVVVALGLAALLFLTLR